MYPGSAEPMGYRAIAGRLRDQIEDGTMPPGSRAPSAADLVGLYGVAKETANRALQRLRGEGLLVGERGKPARVRQPREPIVIKVERGSEITFRPPTAAEVRDLDVGENQSMAVVTFGVRVEVYVCERTTKFTFR